MTTNAISPLRQRMINDMNVRNFVPDTEREYIRAVKNLTIFPGRSPDTATAEDLRAFQLHMTETGVRPPTTPRPCPTSRRTSWQAPGEYDQYALHRAEAERVRLRRPKSRLSQRASKRSIRPLRR